VKRLALNSGVLKDLPGLPAKQYRQVVGAILDLLNDSRPHYSKQLKGSPYLRLAVGEYRVIYRDDEETVYVAVVGKRNDSEVYRVLERKG
jgi:mRNA interferase RelE/StbE